MGRQGPQLKLLKDQPKAYGGTLLTTRKGRSQPRPLDTKNTMHLVLYSSKAKGQQAFWLPQNKKAIQHLSQKLAVKFGIKICSLANVGNHLHYQIKLGNRFCYKPFIRALTAAIAMAITGASRWNPLRPQGESYTLKNRFWDHRPFTRVVVGYKAYLNLKDYIALNQLEGFGVNRSQGRFFLDWNKLRETG